MPCIMLVRMAMKCWRSKQDTFMNVFWMMKNTTTPVVWAASRYEEEHNALPFFLPPERKRPICWRRPHFMDERRERNQEELYYYLRPLGKKKSRQFKTGGNFLCCYLSFSSTAARSAAACLARRATARHPLSMNPFSFLSLTLINVVGVCLWHAPARVY